MALFRILKGLQEKLEDKAKIDGQILVCTDTGNIYVDFFNEVSNEVERVQLNALNADKAKYLTWTDEENGVEQLIGAEDIGQAIAFITDALGDKWTNNSDTITIKSAVLKADKEDGEEGALLTIATKEYVESMIGDVASLLAEI